MVEAPPSFNAKVFRETLGLFATGVTVVTTTTATGDRLGTTASSFNSVSLNPPLVLFSLARNAKSFDAWLQARSYAVNILSEEQDHISNRFARALTDKWNGVVCKSGPTTNQPLFRMHSRPSSVSPTRITMGETTSLWWAASFNTTEAI